MRKSRFIAYVTLLAFVLTTGSSFNIAMRQQKDTLTGAWYYQSENGASEAVWTFVDGYAVNSVYNKAGKRFIETSGGPYRIQGDQLIIQLEFNTADSASVGRSLNLKFDLDKDQFTIHYPGFRHVLKRLDNGSGPLAGVWRISGRMQDGKIVESRPGPRKTLKVLSGTRFQWIAINPEVKGFYGTGGGTYTFTNGKYTENIEFFSRDNSRVGASLTFDGKVEDGAWHHSGLSSRGEPLNEIWKRVKP